MRSNYEELKDRIKAYIEQTADRGGNCPSYREIASALDTSASSVCRYLAAMEKSGEVTLGEFGYETRAMRKADEPMVKVPILGSVPCGPLTEEYENIDGYIKLPVSLVGQGKFFVLTASGDSMTGAGINNGDLVLVRQQESADDGEIVVALVENEVTLKRLYRDEKNRRVILHPENDALQDIIVDGCEIQGVAVKVIKDLV